MKETAVPQDKSSTYADNKKAIYATKADGSINIVESTGWDVEAEATRQALSEIDSLSKKAYKAVASNQKSPLYYHMFHSRMDLAILSQSVGRFQFMVKRDFNPARFKKLKNNVLAQYADVLGISVDVLKKLPPSPGEQSPESSTTNEISGENK